MPVRLDSHTPAVELDPGTTKSDLVAFLYRNDDLGYRPTEVADEIDISQGTATTTLARLYDEGHLGKTSDGYYHALAHREDLRRYVAALDQLTRMFTTH